MSTKLKYQSQLIQQQTGTIGSSLCLPQIHQEQKTQNFKHFAQNLKHCIPSKLRQNKHKMV